MIPGLTLLCVTAAAQGPRPFTHADTLRGSTTAPERTWWDVTFYDLHVTIAPGDSSIRGWNGITYRVVAPARELQIDLMVPLVVDSMIQDGKAVPFRRDGNAVFASLPGPVPVPSMQTIAVYYHGHPQAAKRPPWDGGFTWTSDSLGRPWFVTTDQGLGASVWWPNKDTQADEPDSQRIALTVPDSLPDVSNGRLRGMTHNADGTTTYEWFVVNPINNYAIVVDAGHYAHYSDVFQGEAGPLRLDFWPLDYHLQAAHRQFEQAKTMLKCFEHWFGPYPWYEDGYKLIEVPHTGMEHQSAIAYGNWFANGYRGRDLSGTGLGLKWDFIIVHESAHEWFGNNITAKDEADIWVHESFANYAENLYTECLFGRDSGAAYVIGTRRGILNDMPIVGPYGVNADGSGDRYPKGGNLLHTIRQIVGNDERWRQILRGLNTTFWHQTVTGAQIESYISEHAGTDLTKVFDQYLRTTKIPRLEYKIEGSTLSYRWSNVVAQFNMPLRVTVEPTRWVVIHPVESWQTLPVHLANVAQFRVDSNYYVTAQDVSPPDSTAPYRRSSLPFGDRVRDLLGRMTRDEKFWQLYMTPGDLSDPRHDYSAGVFGLQLPATGVVDAKDDAVRVNAVQRYFTTHTRLGIPIIPFEEAAHGLVRPGATVFPQAIALAATWDSGLVGNVAAAIAEEARGRGIRQVLSPVLNVASDVRWGRVEETYGEDPYLVSTMGAAFVRTLERAGVVTTSKHFVANIGDGGRDSYPIEVSERRLAEEYFPPFEAAVRSGARSIMTAYNSVDGVPMTQQRHLLHDVLKQSWKFWGFVISDAAATGGATVLHLTEPTTTVAAQHAWQAGLDVVFQSTYEQHVPYLDALRRGLVADSVIDSAVARVLAVKFLLGLFEHPYVDTLSPPPRHDSLALAAAREAIVLLKNTRGVLPLPAAIRPVAVIGVDAAAARLGGYTAPGARGVSILDALRARLGPGAVRYAAGPGRSTPEVTGVPAPSLARVRGEYFDNPDLRGPPRLVRDDSVIDFSWTFNPPASELSTDWYSVRWTGTLTGPPGGAHRLGVTGSDGYRLYLDDSLVIDDWPKQSAGTSTAAVTIAPGTPHRLRLEYHETTGNAHVRLVWDGGVSGDWRATVDSAVVAARGAAAAIVVAGIEEGEFRDRATLSLPGHQEDLIAAVAATGTPVIVVLIGGSAITMSRWIDRVAAVIDAWYPGEQGGRAVADVLFGDANPAGRLPITFPLAEGQLPLVYNHKPTGRGDDYVDLTGQPLFPFGFGLSYTTFVYSQFSIAPAEIAAGDTAIVRCRVTNTGPVTGDEVVQLYVHDLLASVARPVLQLVGARRIHLAPGETRDVAFVVGPAALRLLNREGRWVVEPGTFRVLIGGSSRDIRLRGDLGVHP